MPVLDPYSLEFISRSPEQTRRAGMRLGAMLRPGDLICLNGDLGSGKTTFVQGVSAGWGSLDPVSSPTFVLVNVYRRSNGTPAGKTGPLKTGYPKPALEKAVQRLYHLDAYRLSGAEEAEALDLDNLLESGPMVVEWADRIRNALPEECLTIGMRYVDEEQRDLVLTAHGTRYQEMLHEFRRQVYGVF